ncbi:MAG: hypothetical protein GWP03_06695, partial [Proteobacteria bacterium]|nr:hypothetical protein [Pseudomonadota bacterium]
MKNFWKNPVVKFVGAVLILILLAYVLRPFVKNWDETVKLFKTFKPLSLLAGIILLSLTVCAYPLIWRSILSKFGTRIGVKQAYKAWVYSNVGKYIPGKIWQFAGRIMLTKEAYGEVIVITMLLETVISGVAAITVFLWGTLIGGIFTAVWVKYLSISLPILIVLLHPFFLKQILKILSKIRKVELHKQFTMKYTDILMYLVIYIFLWIMTGLAFWIMFFGSAIRINLIDLASSYALSWILGYASLFAPGGLGVREGAIAFLLNLKYPAVVSSTFAVLTRISFVVTDFLLFGVFYLYFKITEFRKGKNEDTGD